MSLSGLGVAKVMFGHCQEVVDVTDGRSFAGGSFHRFRQNDFGIIVLAGSKQDGASEGTSVSYINYFLAMTEHYLVNPDAAQGHLSDANASAETELAGSPVWNRRLTLALLKAETMALIGKKMPPSDGAGEDKEKSEPDPKVIDASDGTTP